MKTVKFRYTQADKTEYYTLVLPDDAVQMVGHDLNGAEVYDGDKLADYRDGRNLYAALNAFTYEQFTPPHHPCRLRRFNAIKP